MNKSHPLQQENLIRLLEEIDEKTRASRARRVEWLALHEPQMMAAVIGRTETMHLLREAREVFINGNFIATLLIAMSFIEHTIVEDLQALEYAKGSPTFSDAITLAEFNKLFPGDWLIRAKCLGLRRNPFAHLKSPAHQHGLGHRVQTEKLHPDDILEADAKDSISLMYDFFVITLRRAEDDVTKEA